jgi:hypothetical protein
MRSRLCSRLPSPWGASDARWRTMMGFHEALVMAALPFLVVRHRKLRFAIAGAVILATGWACTAGGP